MNNLQRKRSPFSLFYWTKQKTWRLWSLWEACKNRVLVHSPSWASRVCRPGGGGSWGSWWWSPRSSPPWTWCSWSRFLSAGCQRLSEWSPILCSEILSEKARLSPLKHKLKLWKRTTRMGLHRSTTAAPIKGSKQADQMCQKEFSLEKDLIHFPSKSWTLVKQLYSFVDIRFTDFLL